MAEKFANMLGQYLQENPRAWKDWKKEKGGRVIRIVRGNVGIITSKLIGEFKEYARMEDEYTRTKIRRAVKNVEDRNWARKKKIELEVDYVWGFYKDSLFFRELFEKLGGIPKPRVPLLLEEPVEHKKARDDYRLWVEVIGARVFASLEGQAVLISEDLEDNSPYLEVPKK